MKNWHKVVILSGVGLIVLVLIVVNVVQEKEKQALMEQYPEEVSAESNAEEIESKIASKQEELNALETEIKEKEDRLAALEGELVKYEGKPIQINPGFYYFGIDNIPSGRYKITAQEGQRGNVFIRNEEGSYVAETFGDGTEGSIKEFTFYAEEGDELEATIPVNLYSVSE